MCDHFGAPGILEFKHRCMLNSYSEDRTVQLFQINNPKNRYNLKNTSE